MNHSLRRLLKTNSAAARYVDRSWVASPDHNLAFCTPSACSASYPASLQKSLRLGGNNTEAATKETLLLGTGQGIGVSANSWYFPQVNPRHSSPELAVLVRAESIFFMYHSTQSA